MLKTPLYKMHEDHGAHFVDFFGWEMPIRYRSIIEEHQHTRQVGGFFDVSHMARLKFTGRHARRLLETVLTREITSMAPLTCRYSLICNEQGGTIDDVLVYRFEDHWLVVANASNREKVLGHFQQVVKDQQMSCQIEDQTESTAMVAIQGPRVMDMVQRFSKEIPTLKRYHFRVKNLMILKMIVSRTGYTGEDGIEVILPAKMASMAIKLLLKESGDENADVKPVGLGARDSLRMEAGMPLYGHELDEQIDPITAGLKFAVTLNKGKEETDGPVIPNFIGQEALTKIASEGPTKKLVGIKLEGKRTPRQDMPIQIEGESVGYVTSGCLSPTLGYPIAMGYVKADSAQTGQTVTIEATGGKQLGGEIVDLPFYKRS